jgi:hypothetical protein
MEVDLNDVNYYFLRGNASPEGVHVDRWSIKQTTGLNSKCFKHDTTTIPGSIDIKAITDRDLMTYLGLTRGELFVNTV